MDDVITAPPDTAVRPLGVHHVSINVDDLAVARSFYVDVLGFTASADRPDFPGTRVAWLNVGGQHVHLIVGEVPARLGQQYAVLVADIDSAVEALRERGVRVSDPVEVGTGLQSFTRDPSGNIVEIHEAGGVAPPRTPRRRQCPTFRRRSRVRQCPDPPGGRRRVRSRLVAAGSQGLRSLRGSRTSAVERASPQLRRVRSDEASDAE